MRAHALLRAFGALFAVAVVAAACGTADSTTDTAAIDDAAVSDDDADPAHDGEGHGDHDDHDHDDHGAEDHEDHGDHDGDGHDSHGDHDVHDDDHGHGHGEPVEVDAANAPTVAVAVDGDPAGGINLEVTTTGFTVNAAAASTDHVEGEGHFHLFIDGERVQRFYNRSVYFAGVTEGPIEVMVELSANDHRVYAVNGEPITATVSFDVPAHDHGAHDHGEAGVVEWEGAEPQLAVDVVEDPTSGYNVFVTVDGMTVSADNVNGDHVAGEGHLHIYVNDQKIGRLYGPATHIPALPAGDVEITVGAYANDHRSYVVAGTPIATSTVITVTS